MKILFSFFLLVSSVLSVTAQEKVWLNKSSNWVIDSTEAVRYAIITKEEPGKLKVEEYTIDGTKKNIGYYSKYTGNRRDRVRMGMYTQLYSNGKDSVMCFYKNNAIEGQSKTYFPDGSAHFIESYHSGYLNGYFIQYYPDGKLRRKEYYSKGECTKGELYAEDGSKLKHEPYLVMPQFKGGMNAFINILSTVMIYPAQARSKKIEGKVIIGFYINTEGKMEDFSFVKRVDPILDAEAMRTIEAIASSYKWIPGRRDGQPMRTRYSMPIRFRLPQ